MGIKIFQDKNTTKSNKFIKLLLSFICCLVPMILIWALIAQFNATGTNWMVHQNGKFLFSNDQIQQFINNPEFSQSAKDFFVNPNGGFNNLVIWKPFHSNQVTQTDIDIINKTLNINFGNYIIFDPIVLAFIFGVLVANIIIFTLVSLFSKKIFFDIFTSILPMWLGGLGLIFCSYFPEGEPWTIPVTILVIAAVWILSTILFNYLMNLIILNSSIANTYYQKLLKENKESEYYKEEYKKYKNKYKNKDDDSTFVEL